MRACGCKQLDLVCCVCCCQDGHRCLSRRARGSVPGLGGLKETKLFLPHPRVKVSIVGSLRDREVACSVSDRQGSNFESCVWRTVSSQSSHHPQEVLLAQFSLYVHKGGLKPDSFHFAAKISVSYRPCIENQWACWPYPIQLCFWLMWRLTKGVAPRRKYFQHSTAAGRCIASSIFILKTTS